MSERKKWKEILLMLMPSKKLVSEGTGSISMFSGFYETRPCLIRVDIPFAEIVGLVVPEKPIVKPVKEYVKAFVCSELADSPLIGETLIKALKEGEPTIGKQRSSTHVVSGSWIKFDLDGITQNELKDVKSKLKDKKLGYALYTTHSHGLKPNIRARVLLFLDRSLKSKDYQIATLEAAKWLLGKSLDKSDANLSQQQAVYCAHPERVQWARKTVHLEGFCIDVDELLKDAPKQKTNSYNIKLLSSEMLLDSEKERIKNALTWIDPNTYDSWVKVCMCLKALEAKLGSEALDIWIRFSNQAVEVNKQKNEMQQYDPEIMFNRMSPTMTSEAAIGTLLGMAKEEVLNTLYKAHIKSMEQTFYGKELDATVYLKNYHYEAFTQFLNSIELQISEAE